MIFFFAKIAEKARKLTQNRNLRVQMKILVAPLSIVLTQSCMNYEH